MGPLPATKSPSAAVHLKFIDGLRGSCALYIMLHHSMQLSDFPTIPAYLTPFGWGHYCVTVFIVISGFCLTLPVLHSGFVLRKGVLDFYKRRARRILPPYYAALLLGVLLLPAQSGHPLNYALLLNHQMLVPLLLHLLMLQNWSAAYLFTFNAPLWSIAVECQIYLIFPLILLLWRRAGLLATLVVTFLLAHGVLKAMHHHGTANYLFIFFLGMWGASLTLKGDRMPPWEWLALAAAVILPFVCWNDTAGDLCIGVMISILMASCAVRLRNPVRELLSFGPLCWIGTFSYSIYLIHSVVQLVFLNNLSIMSSLTSTTRFVLFVTACTPLILILSYLFYLVLERPFLSKRARNPALADVVPETSAEPGLVTAG